MDAFIPLFPGYFLSLLYNISSLDQKVNIFSHQEKFKENSEETHKKVAIDTLLGKRSILIKIITRVFININIAIFQFIHKSFSYAYNNTGFYFYNTNICLQALMSQTLSRKVYVD